MKVAFVSLICYDFLYKKEIREHREEADYFDTKILASHPDPVHKWCKMLYIKNIDVEFWYFACLSKTSKLFKHKYGHRLRRIPARRVSLKYLTMEISFKLLKELKHQKITHILVTPYLLNRYWLIDMFDLLAIFCKIYGIKVFPIFGGGSISNYNPLKRKIKLFFLKQATGIFYQSKAELNIMINILKFPKSKIFYFKNPLDLENFKPLPRDKSAACVGLDPSKKYLIYVGRFSDSKGIQHLIHIFPKLLKIEPKLESLLIGWGPYKKELQKLIKYHGLENKIWLKDFVPNEYLKYYYNIADVFVLPSYTEGVPNVLMEAIACNTVCVASNVGGVPDLLGNGLGILVPPKNEKALYDAIVNVLSNGFEINQKKRLELLHEIDLYRKANELKEILMSR